MNDRHQSCEASLESRLLRLVDTENGYLKETTGLA
jgi:hypothetical protein